MPIVVKVVEPEAFQAFLDSQREPEPAAVTTSSNR
jgi:hypothetical protein